MSSITLVQIAEKPITVTKEDMISSFADNRQGRLTSSWCGPNPINSLPDEWDAPGMVAVGLNSARWNHNALIFRCWASRFEGFP
jgi:hypothetical protein